MKAYHSDAWTVLGDPSRRSLVERLATGPRTVAELADDMPISRPAVSQHLKVLLEAGLVHSQPEGRNRVYSLDSARLKRYREQLDGFWVGTLANLADTIGDVDEETG